MQRGQARAPRPPTRWRLLQPGLKGPRQPEAVRARPGRLGRLYLSPVPQSTSCPETDWTCLHIAWSPPMPTLPGNSALPGGGVCVCVCVCVTLWASESPHSLETVSFLVCVCVIRGSTYVCVSVCVMRGHSQILWASDSPHSQALPPTTVDMNKPHSFWASVSLLVKTSGPPGNHGGWDRGSMNTLKLCA